MTAPIFLGSAILSYFLGSIPTGFLWAKARGIDIRKVGSGNIGATNVMRTVGKGSGILVLLLDAAKGFLPVFFAPRVFSGVDRDALQIVCCVSVIAGHNWTCWLKFKGGKGVATSAGALLAFLPGPLLCGLGVWLVVFAIGRYVSLASIGAAVAVPIATWLIEKNATLLVFTVILGAVAIYKHKSNIQRLLAGTENRVGTKRKDPHPDSLPGRERGTAADVSSPRLRGEDRGEGHSVK
jgi:glycerol-3-phosphate acyltransferase PlsY